MKQISGALAFVALMKISMVVSAAGALQTSADVVASPKSSPPKLSFSFSIYDKPRPLPGFSFMGEDGRALTLADFRGKVILLNVWATWCPPCREEMPTLDRLQARLGGADFEVIALSIDQEGVGVIRDFYRSIGIKALRVYVEPTNQPPPALNVRGLPTTLLIDGQGREIGWKAGPAEWDTPEVEALIRWYQKIRLRITE